MVKVTLLLMFVPGSLVSPLKNFYSNLFFLRINTKSSIPICTYCAFFSPPSPCDQFTSKTEDVPQLTAETQARNKAVSLRTVSTSIF